MQFLQNRFVSAFFFVALFNFLKIFAFFASPRSNFFAFFAELEKKHSLFEKKKFRFFRFASLRREAKICRFFSPNAKNFSLRVASPSRAKKIFASLRFRRAISGRIYISGLDYSLTEKVISRRRNGFFISD